MSDHTESTPDLTVPAAGGITLSVRRDEGKLVLAIAGELDALTAPGADQTAQRALADKPAVLVLDLTQVRFLGSAGLSMLLATHQRAAPHSEVRIVAATQPSQRSIELTGLDRELTIFASLAEALGTP